MIIRGKRPSHAPRLRQRRHPPLHATVNSLLCVLFIAESGHRVQKDPRSLLRGF
jgi:hypothetical protein